MRKRFTRSEEAAERPSRRARGGDPGSLLRGLCVLRGELATMCPGALVGNGQDQVLPRGTLVVSVISGTCHGCNEMLNRTAVGSDRDLDPANSGPSSQIDHKT